MKLLTAAAEELKSLNIDFTQTQLGSIDALVGAIATDCGYLHCYFFTAAKEQYLMLLAYTGQKVPEGSLRACRELVCHISGNLLIGSFSIDDDGELMIRCSTLIGAEILSDRVVTLVSVARGAANRYLPAFNSIIYGNEEAKTAFEHASL